MYKPWVLEPGTAKGIQEHQYSLRTEPLYAGKPSLKTFAPRLFDKAFNLLKSQCF